MKRVLACTSIVPVHVSLNDVKAFVEPLTPLAVKHLTKPDQRLDLDYIGYEKEPESIFYTLYFKTKQGEKVDIRIGVSEATKLGLTPLVLRERHWEDEDTYFKIETQILITPLDLSTKQFDFKLVIAYNIHFYDYVDEEMLV